MFNTVPIGISVSVSLETQTEMEDESTLQQGMSFLFYYFKGYEVGDHFFQE